MSEDLRPGTLFLLFERDDSLPADVGTRVLVLLLLLALARTPPPTISDFLRRNGTSRFLRVLSPLLKGSCSLESSGSTDGANNGKERMSYSMNHTARVLPRRRLSMPLCDRTFKVTLLNLSSGFLSSTGVGGCAMHQLLGFLAAQIIHLPELTNVGKENTLRAVVNVMTFTYFLRRCQHLRTERQ